MKNSRKIVDEVLKMLNEQLPEWKRDKGFYYDSGERLDDDHIAISMYFVGGTPSFCRFRGIYSISQQKMILKPKFGVHLYSGPKRALPQDLILVENTGVFSLKKNRYMCRVEKLWKINGHKNLFWVIKENCIGLLNIQTGRIRWSGHMIEVGDHDHRPQNGKKRRVDMSPWSHGPTGLAGQLW
jgi:hypothetical protein